MTKLEEIARAICVAQGADPNIVLAINESYSGAPVADIARPLYRQPQFIEAARAAVEAMREPSEKMKRLDESLAPRWSHGTYPPQLFNQLGSHTGASWQQMIDAILNEKR